MRWFVAAVLVVHGLIHLMGPAKAFRWAELPALRTPISATMGVVWLLAALMVLASALSLLLWPRAHWVVGAVALLFSQLVIVSAWSDARFGTLANFILLLSTAYSFFMHGPTSLEAQARRDFGAALSTVPAMPVVSESDLEPLPEPVRRYLRAAGVIGKPRVHNYRLRFRGRIRGAPDDPWMPFVAEQLSTVEPARRHFMLHATRAGLPVEVYHRLVDGHASMEVRLLGAITMVKARGEVMDRSETVTLFNDMSILAPATLVEPTITWEALSSRSARAQFHHGAHTISATLKFDEDGMLRDFESDDRSRASADGTSFERLRFTTPVRDYRDYGPAHLFSHGEARWHLAKGSFAYGEFELLEIAYNVREP